MESVGETGHVVIPPATDVILDREEADGITAKLGKMKTSGAVNDIIEDVSGKLELDPTDPSLVWITPFITDKIFPVSTSHIPWPRPANMSFVGS